MKTIAITGSSSGIGKATAIYFAEKGWQVIATMRSPEKEQELTHYKNIKLYALDVCNDESVANAINNIIDDYKKIDVIVNNAGYGAIGIFEKAELIQIQRQFDTNVFGVMRVCKAILPHFRQQQAGTIINISSVAGRVAFPIFSIYHGSKWALEGFSESLQYEVAQWNIRIKLVEPGPIKTDFYSRSQDLFKNDEIKGYEKIEDKAINMINTMGNKGPEAILVAKTIYKAATDTSKKLRYPVGFEASALLWIRSILPNRWFRAIVKTVMM